FQEIFSTWCCGGTLVLIDEAARRDPEALLAFVSEQRVERLFLPFVALQSLCEAAGHLGAAIPSLREVITAGEQLKVTDAVRGSRRATHRRSEPRAWVFEPSRADKRTVRSGSVRPGPGRSSVPDGRPRALSARRQRRLHRSLRSPSKDPWLSGGARRDRGDA